MLRNPEDLGEARIEPVDEPRRAAKRRREADREVRRSSDDLDHALIRRDVGASEPIDRLLWITDDGERPGCELHRVPRRRLGGPLAQEQHDLGLKRIGVLELVDEDVIEHLLARASDRAVVAKEVSESE